jgi:hypothetical protein
MRGARIELVSCPISTQMLAKLLCQFLGSYVLPGIAGGRTTSKTLRCELMTQESDQEQTAKTCPATNTRGIMQMLQKSSMFPEC